MSLASATVVPARAFPERGVLRHSRWDAALVALALAHFCVLLVLPITPVIALGLWWNSNTISHNFIHKPFFRSRLLNALFALCLSALLGIPQFLWRERHLAHHAGIHRRPRVTWQAILEIAVIVALWGTLLTLQPRFFVTVYLPGYAAGLLLCWLHGHYEHARGTVSHYGSLYNLLFFNDGFHVEHHARPGTHWTQLPEHVRPGAQTSRWPAVLRWLEVLQFVVTAFMRSAGRDRMNAVTTSGLNALERWVLRSPRLQQFVLQRHEKAFRRLLPLLPVNPRVAIVGGGLFPRTLLILQRLLPDARFVVIDRSAANIETAREFPADRVEFVNQLYDPDLLRGCDLVIFPLAFIGDRTALYWQPPGPVVIIHDWIWRRRGESTIVSCLLFKRLNLVRP